MIKLLGILFVFFPICTVGFFAADRIKKSQKFWEEMLLFNKQTEIEICYKSSDIFKIAEECFSENKYPSLPFLKDFQSLRNRYFYSDIKLFFEKFFTDRSEIKILSDYFYKIGKSDLENQLKHLKMYEKIFNSRKKFYENKYSEKAKVYKSVSVFFGIGLAIWFI